MKFIMFVTIGIVGIALNIFSTSRFETGRSPLKDSVDRPVIRVTPNYSIEHLDATRIISDTVAKIPKNINLNIRTRER